MTSDGHPISLCNSGFFGLPVLMPQVVFAFESRFWGFARELSDDGAVVMGLKTGARVRSVDSSEAIDSQRELTVRQCFDNRVLGGSRYGPFQSQVDRKEAERIKRRPRAAPSRSMPATVSPVRRSCRHSSGRSKWSAVLQVAGVQLPHEQARAHAQVDFAVDLARVADL